VEAEREVAPRVVPLPREAVDDAIEGHRALRAENVRSLGVCLADVDDERKAEGLRELDRAGERRPLRGAGRMVVVEIETGLPDRHDTGVAGQAGERREGGLVGGRGVMRMDPDRGHDLD